MTLFIDDGSSADQVLTVGASPIAPGGTLTITLPSGAFGMPSPITTTPGAPGTWTYSASTLTFQCGPYGPCTVGASAIIDGPGDVPLDVDLAFTSGSVQASWSGGATQWFSAPGANATLPPA